MPLLRTNYTNEIEFAKTAVAAIGGLNNLESIEIGNEPYPYVPKFRDQGYRPSDYAEEFRAYQEKLEEGLELSGSCVFQAGDTAWFVSNWTIPQILSTRKPNLSIVFSVGQR
jgi:hypothetical protein